MVAVTPIGARGVLPRESFWRGRRVLLTGHTGFKGSWLTVWLRALGAEVTGLSLAAEPGSLGALLDVQAMVPGAPADIRNREAVREAVSRSAPEIVVHMAAQALVRASYADPIGTFETNVLGTAHLLDAVREAGGVRAVLVVTTDKCYENREWTWPYRETDALGGYDPYSASKAGAELVTASWRRSFLAEQGVAVVSARAGNVIGGGDWADDRLVPDCIRAFAAGSEVHLRHPAATRPWQHVLEPLSGYLLLVEAVSNGAVEAGAWNFGPSADSVATVAEVVAEVAQAWGEGARWSADPGPHPHEAGLLALDASLARRHLQWRPRLNLRQSIGWTVAWYRRQLDGASPRRLIEEDIERYCTETA